MKREELYRDKNLLLEYVTEGNYIHETWWGITPKEVFLNHLEIILKNLKAKGASGLLLDTREHKGLGPESQKIAAKRIGEYSRSIGGLKEAIIVPQDVFSKFSVENYTKNMVSDALVSTRFFNNVPEAESWLRAEKETMA
ncbi:MAG: hypothetical protein ACOC10_05990 [Bacteroidota bacterium]